MPQLRSRLITETRVISTCTSVNPFLRHTADCALLVEKAAVEALLGKEHGKLAAVVGDDNSCSCGRIGELRCRSACLPAAMMGSVLAADVARDVMRCFTMKAGFSVGIGGGV